MMEKNNKYYLFSILYIISYVVFPAVVLLLSLWNQSLEIKNETYLEILRFDFLLVTLPIYAVYSTIIFKEIVYKSLKKVLFLFVPIILTIILMLVNYNKSTTSLQLILDSLPMFLGIYTSLFAGLLILVVKKTNKTDKHFFAKILVTIILFIVIGFPVFHFYKIGFKISEMLSTSNIILSKIKFLLSIFIVIFFHYKIIIELYEKGEF